LEKDANMPIVSLKERVFIKYLSMNVESTKFKEYLKLKKLEESIHPLASYW
jgi:hypothetical protein